MKKGHRKCLRQVKHIHGHLWHRYSIANNQVILSKTSDDINLTSMNLGSVSSLLAATLYQGNPDRNHKLWNIGLTKYTYSHIKITGARDTDLPPPPFFFYLSVHKFIFNKISLFLYYFISFSLFWLVRVNIHTILC